MNVLYEFFLTDHETAGSIGKVLSLRIHESGLEFCGRNLSRAVFVYGHKPLLHLRIYRIGSAESRIKRRLLSFISQLLYKSIRNYSEYYYLQQV